MENNPYDELGNMMNEAKVEDRRIDRRDQLIHQVFAQNELGAELMALWEVALMMSPTAAGGMTDIEIGIEEGKKTFIRNIKLTINRIEEDS